MASQLNYSFPFIPAAVVVLGVWRVVEIWLAKQEGRFRFSWLGFVARLAWVAFLVLNAGPGGVFLYLAGAFVVSCVRGFKQVRHGGKVAAAPLRRLVVLNIAVVALMVPFVVWGYVRRNAMDPIDQLRTYIYQGTGPERVFIRQRLADPAFDLEHLSALMGSAEPRDRDIAFYTLFMRENPNDLRAVRESLLALPTLNASLSDDYTHADSIYVRLWLSKIDVPLDIRTSASLAAWIDANTTAPVTQR